GRRHARTAVRRARSRSRAVPRGRRGRRIGHADGRAAQPATRAHAAVRASGRGWRMTGLWDGLLLGLGTTLLIWVGAIVVSLVLGSPPAALRRADHWAPRLLGGAWAALARGIPPIVWIILVFYGLKFGPFQSFPPLAAMVALGVVNSAYVGDAIRAGLDSVPRG